jgi:HSP20 family protein
MLTRKKETALARRTAASDPFAMLRQFTSQFDRLFPEPSFGWPLFRARQLEQATWFPEIDVFERDNRLVTKIDLPGLKKDEVKVEIVDGQLAISGERKSEAEEKREDFYRCEREYGSFYRSVPLPEGAKLEDVKATFADGVLEVSVPLAVKAAAKPQTVEIQEPPNPAKTAA